MTTDDAKEQAEALLATVRKKLSGMEIAACEWTKSEEFEDEVYALDDDTEYPEEPLEEDFDDEEEFSEAHLRWEEEMDQLTDQDRVSAYRWTTLKRLSTEFAREIGNWINKRNLARARKTTVQP